ncbi:MAG: hypothetical protein JWP57_2884 [Spirosoma sp.]|nr:hypothetical protein [Spirosoma sp.]
MTGQQKPFDLDKILRDRLDIDFALKAAGLGVWELNPATNEVNWDTRCQELYGLMDKHVVLYEHILALIHPDDVERIDQAVRWAMNRQSSGSYDATYRIPGAKDGQLRWVRFTGQSYFNEAGEVYRFAGVGKDVTQDVLAQQRLAESEQRFRTLIEQAPVAIAVFRGEEFLFDTVNDAYLPLIGKTRQQVEGKPLFEVLPETRQDLEPLARELVRTGNAFPANEFELVINRHGRDERAYFNSIWEPLRQDDGRIDGFIVVAHEVTTQVVARKHAEESEAKLRSLIEEAPVATALFVGPQMRIELANEIMISFFGRGPSILGKPVRDVLTAPGDAMALHLLDTVFDTGNAYEAMGAPAELVINGVAGTYYFNISLKPLRNVSGDVYAVMEMAVDVTEQVITQQELQASEARFRSIVKQAPMAIGLLGGREMVLEVVNDNLLTIWGKESSITGLRLKEALPQFEGQGLMELLERIYDSGESFTDRSVAAQLQRGGQLENAYFDFVYTPLRDTNQIVTGVMVLANEVTQEVRARRAIEASEVKLRSVIASAPAAIGLFVGRELRVELFNQAFIDIVGKGPDIAGKPLREVMPELVTENQPFLSILDEVYTSGQRFQSYGSQVDIVQQGVMSHNYYNITYTPLRDESGEVYAILDIAIDVTEEIKARQQLAEAEEALRGAIELARLGTWSLDPSTGVVTFSERIRSWFGFENQANQDTVYNPIHEGDRQRVADAITNALKPESGGIYDQEYRVVNDQTGQERILHAQGQAFFDAQGKPVKLVGTAQDVTEQRLRQQTLEQQVREQTEELAATNEELAMINEELASQNQEYVAVNGKLAESTQQLVRSNENLQRFAYIASHDLQEPLRKVQQFGDLLKSGYGAQIGEGLVYLERMQLAASRMSTLIRDLLEFSRLSTQREMNTPVSLDEIIDRVLTTLELVITETNAVIKIGPLPTVSGDALQLSQLFQNLLSNALKFQRTDVRPLIRISAHQVSMNQLPEAVKPIREATAYHRIDVADNGIGFEEKYLDRIFEVFQRLHARNEYAGTGIGLAICEKVVTNHGGAITANSQPEQGATFSVYLPM